MSGETSSVTKICNVCKQAKPVAECCKPSKTGRIRCKECRRKEYTKRDTPKSALIQENKLLKIVGKKHCNKCSEVKPLDNFYRSKTGVPSWCKTCANKRRKPPSNTLYAQKLRTNTELRKSGLKYCGDCNETKPVTMFPRKGRSQNYNLKSHCIDCHRKRARARCFKNSPNKPLAQHCQKNTKLRNFGLKCCRHCDETKPVAEFRTQREGTRSYLKSYCADCENQKANESNTNNKESVMLYNARKRAKQRSYEFNLTIDDVIFGQTCQAIGIPLDRKTQRMNDGTPTLDRIDVTKGYVKGNVAVICHRANRIKNNATLSELRQIVAYMERHMEPSSVCPTPG